MGLQFEPLKNLTSPHLGLFWTNYLEKSWIDIKEAPLLQPQAVKFGKEHLFRTVGLKLETARPPMRTQFIHESKERMIQVQSDRFVLNWRKNGQDYPTYQSLNPEFWKYFNAFREFVKENKLGQLKPNHWEVTYVNHIKKGELWSSLAEWENVFPNAFSPCDSLEGQVLETFNSDWQMILGERSGRLSIQLRHTRLAENEDDEAIDLRLTAQGPASEDIEKLNAAFDLGHEAIVRRFCQMTSSETQKYWQRRV